MALLALLIVLVGAPAMTLTSDTSSARATEPAAQATLKIVGISPLAVSGRAFRSGERVRVSADGRRKTVTARVSGGFKVSFPGANTCNGVVVSARGSEGSRAAVAFANFSNVHCLEPGAKD